MDSKTMEDPSDSHHKLVSRETHSNPFSGALAGLSAAPLWSYAECGRTQIDPPSCLNIS
jgi:hypothetical protein